MRIRGRPAHALRVSAVLRLLLVLLGVASIFQQLPCAMADGPVSKSCDENGSCDGSGCDENGACDGSGCDAEGCDYSCDYNEGCDDGCVCDELSCDGSSCDDKG